MARPLHIFVWGPEAPLRRELDQAAPGFWLTREVLPQRGIVFAPGVEIGEGRRSPPFAPLPSPSRSYKSLLSGEISLWLFLLSRREKYCHNGDGLLATITASACLGVHDGDHGPLRRSPVSHTRKYCHGGGAALADRLGWGTMMVPPPPLLVAANRMVKPKTRGCANRGPLGAKMRSSACLQTRQVLPQRGHGLRPPSRRRLAWGPRRRSRPLPAVP
jgi:hypothetical protein